MQLNADHVPNNTHLTHCQMEDYSSLKKKKPKCKSRANYGFFKLLLHNYINYRNYKNYKRNHNVPSSSLI